MLRLDKTNLRLRHMQTSLLIENKSCSFDDCKYVQTHISGYSMTSHRRNTTPHHPCQLVSLEMDKHCAQVPTCAVKVSNFASRLINYAVHLALKCLLEVCIEFGLSLYGKVIIEVFPFYFSLSVRRWHLRMRHKIVESKGYITILSSFSINFFKLI